MQNSSTISISLLEKPTASIGDKGFQPNNLLVFLAFRFPEFTSRDQIIQNLYLGVQNADARNRLRVSLSRLRKDVPLTEIGEHIKLDPTLVSVDLHETKEKLQEIYLEPNEQEELRLLRDLLPKFGSVLFPHAEEDWQLEAQAGWGKIACEALEKLADLAERQDDSALVALAMELSLIHFPYEEETWNRFMRAMARMGQGAKATRKLSVARKKAHTEKWPFPEALDDWLVKVDALSTLGPELSPGESQVLERFFRRTMVAEPELFVEMLGSPSFRPEVLRSPKNALPLLREALALQVSESEARERIEVRMINALSLMEHFEEAVVAGTEFLKKSIGPARRRIMLLQLSFNHAILGHLDLAFDAVHEAMDLAEGPNAAYDRMECKAQRASFYMFQGDFSLAEQELHECLSFFSKIESEGSERDHLAIKGNLGLCHFHQERNMEAMELLLPVVGRAQCLNLQEIIGLNAPILGCAQARLGLTFENTLSQGLKAAYRLSERRAIIAAGYAGSALHCAGMDKDQETLKGSFAFRRLVAVPLNAIEKSLYQSVYDDSTEVSQSLVNFVRKTMKRLIQ